MNCACYLAADMSIGSEEQEEQEVQEVPQLVSDNAFGGVCDISCEHYDILAMFSNVMRIPDLLTDDFALNNPFAMAPKIRYLFSGQMVGIDIAQKCVAMGFNPYTRDSVEGYIPFVSLAHEHNRIIVSSALCRILLEDRNMPQTAWLLFYGICEYLIGAEPDHPDALHFMLDEMDTHILTTPTFDDTTNTKIPLGKAIKVYGSHTGLRRLRKHALSCMVMARRFGKDDAATSTSWVRQAILKHIVECIVSSVKHTNSCNLFDMNFEFELTIPVDSCLPERKNTIEASIFDSLQRCEDALQTTCITTTQIAWTIEILRTMQHQLNSYKIEDLINHLVDSNSTFKKIWNGDSILKNECLSMLRISRFGEKHKY
ncbi:MAG: hypothetical protein VYD39_04140, partial [Bacteroidota bacterium]|nr:hypothetical protein [Bacteroidota bacterium]